MTELYGREIVNRRKYAFWGFTGVVVGEKSWSETSVTGSGGGGSGYIWDGRGSMTVSDVKISSTTTRHDKFILADPNGKERPFSFQGMDIHCRPGNTLSVVWAIKGNADNGPYWFVYNHNSDQLYATAAMRQAFTMPSWRNGASVLLGLCVSALVHVSLSPFIRMDYYAQHFLIIPALFLIANAVMFRMRTMSFEQFLKSEAYAHVFREIRSRAEALSSSSQSARHVDVSPSVGSGDASLQLPPLPASPRIYHRLDQEQRVLPALPLDDLRKMLEQGDIDGSTLVARAGDKEWASLQSVLNR